MASGPPPVAPGAGEHPYGGRGPTLMGVAWTGWIIATVLVSLRFYVRLRMEREGAAWALWWAFAALVSATVAVCLLSVAVHFGFGNHQSELILPQITEALKYQWATDAVSTLSAGFSKLSVVAFLLALQAKTNNRLGDIFLWSLGITNMALNIVVVFTIMFQCNPPAAAWDFTITKANCHIRDVNQTLGLVQAGWNAASDLILAVYPGLIVWRLQIPRRLKLVLVVVMGLGIVAGAFSLVKLYQLSQVSHYAMDYTHHLASLTAWGVVELWSVLIALSIPPIWPLVKPYVEKISSRIERSLATRPAKYDTNSRDMDHATTSKSSAKKFSRRFMGPNSQHRSDSLDNILPHDGIKMTTDLSVDSKLASQEFKERTMEEGSPDVAPSRQQHR